MVAQYPMAVFVAAELKANMLCIGCISTFAWPAVVIRAFCWLRSASCVTTGSRGSCFVLYNCWGLARLSFPRSHHGATHRSQDELPGCRPDAMHSPSIQCLYIAKCWPFLPLGRSATAQQLGMFYRHEGFATAAVLTVCSTLHW